MFAENETIRVLLVENDPEDAREIASLLEESAAARFQVDVAADLRSALEKAAEPGTVDVIILDLALPETGASESVKRLAAAAPHLPQVVLTRIKDEDAAVQALRLGVQDYLFKTKIDSEALTHALKLAIQRHKLVGGEMNSIARFGSGTGTPLTAQMFGQLPLSRSTPGVYNALVRRYTVVLDKALEERAYKVEHEVSEELTSIAEELGVHLAGPKDAVEIHQEALNRNTSSASYSRAEALIREGRWMLIQLLGFLASYYRNYALAASGRPARSVGGPAGQKR